MNFLTAMFGSNLIEITACIAGFICVYLIIKKNIWCWPVGLLQVVLYIFVFYQAKLYSDAILHVIYVVLQIYGWINWARHKNPENQVEIIGINIKTLVNWAVVAILGSLALGWVMNNKTDASFPYGDAFTTVTSLVAQWLLSNRYLANWLFWITVDVVAIYIYWQKALLPTAVLYSLFLIMAITGLRVWIKEFQSYSASTSNPIPEPAP